MRGKFGMYRHRLCSCCVRTFYTRYYSRKSVNPLVVFCVNCLLRAYRKCSDICTTAYDKIGILDFSIGRNFLLHMCCELQYLWRCQWCQPSDRRSKTFSISVSTTSTIKHNCGLVYGITCLGWSLFRTYSAGIFMWVNFHIM